MKYTLLLDKTKEESVVVTAHAPSRLTEELENLVLSYAGTDRISAFTEDETVFLPFGDISSVTVIDRKTYAVAKDGKRYRLRATLTEVAEVLPTYFIRLNKSAFGNQNHIVRFVTTFSGAVDAVFSSGVREYVSRRCLAEIKRRFS